MTKISPEEKQQRTRDRMFEAAKAWQLGTYSRRFVAPIFQQMIRAEYAAKPLLNLEFGAILPVIVTKAVVDGEMAEVGYKAGQCVCITCGKVHPWKGGLDRYSGMHTGHFLASRRMSILFEESNVAPQCSACNVFQNGSPQRFRMWMLAVRGPEVVERLERLKNEVRVFTREELVDLRIGYAARLKAAEDKMKGF